MVDLAELTIEHFSSLGEQPQTLTVPGVGAVSVRVSSTRPLGTLTVPGARRSPFAVVFTGAVPGSFAQQMVTFDHPEHGPFELFVVPIGPTPEGLMRYEAVFT